MTQKEYKKIKKLLNKILSELEEQALTEGLDLTSPEYEALVAKTKSALFEQQGVSLEEYEAEETREETTSNISLLEEVSKLSEKINEVSERSIPTLEEMEEVAKKHIQPPIYKTEIVKEILKETTIEKPKIIETTRHTTIKEKYDDKPIKEELGRILQKLDEVKIPAPLDLEKLKEELNSDFTNLFEHNINTLNMPNFRKLAMGLQAQIDANLIAGTPASPDTSVQFNNGGAFGGDANFTWLNTAKQLVIGDQIASLIDNPGDALMVSKDIEESYLAITIKNTAGDEFASGDFVVANDIDDGTVETGTYGDFGIASSTYNTTSVDIVNQANDVYLYASPGAGNLNIMALGAGKKIQFATAGDTADELRASISSSMFSIYANRGDELAPDLTTGNWTLASGWNYGTSPDRLLKDGDGSQYSGRAEPSAATWVTAGVQYSITVTATVTVGSFNISIGDNPPAVVANTGQNEISATGTYTFYLQAATTDKLMILPLQTNSRFEITALSVKALVEDTGDLLTEGDTNTNSLTLRGTISSDRYRWQQGTGTYNNVAFPPKQRYVELQPSATQTITGISIEQASGDELWLYNNQVSVVSLAHQNVGSDAENRIITPHSGTLGMNQGDLVYLKYYGGTTDRWYATKIASGGAHWNNAGFNAFLDTLLVNSGTMTLGSGNAGVRIEDTSGLTTIGDWELSTNSTRIIVDDDNGRITHYFNDYERRIIPTSDFVLSTFEMGDGTFATRAYELSTNVLIIDEESGVGVPIDASALLEVRSANSTSTGYKGFLPPRMDGASRDSIGTPATGLMVYNTDTNALNFYNGTSWGAIGGSGTVTSVAMSVPTGLSISGSPITTSGTLAVSLGAGYVIPLQTTIDGKANTALSNLASVAINTTLVSDTDNTDALGTSAIAWSDLFLGSGAVITFNSAPSTSDVTITHSSNALTFDGGAYIFNEAGADFDFRIEGTGQANALFVDGANGNVGFGTNAPTANVSINSLAVTGREELFKATVSDVSTTRFDIFNATMTDGSFIPCFQGYNNGSTTIPLFFSGMSDATNDSGTNPYIVFTARTTATDPINGTYSAVTTRPIAQFRNQATALMTVMPDGNVGVGISAPTAKLHVDQASTTGAIPVLTLDQADLSEEFINFVGTVGTGNSIEAVGAKTLTTTHFLRIQIEGVGYRYLPVGTIA